MSFSEAEVRFLAAHAEEIAEVEPELGLTKASLFADRALLERCFGERARAVLELAAARRGALAKFPAWWLTDADAAQQATPARVAAVRAARLRGHGVEIVHDVTCSVGSEAPAARAEGLAWLGSDLDPARLLMARHNLGPGAWLARADALAPVGRAGAVVADPARREGGRRITDPAKLHPPLPALLEAHAGRELAVKCAPGIDYSGWEGLVSVISLDGGVKEACLYTPGLAGGVTREAVVLDGGNGSGEGAERVTDAEDDAVDVGAAREFIVEPDGAIIRAGLVRHWAHRHGLSMLDEHIAFLTGDAVPPGYSGFRVLEEVPLKKLRAALASHDAGSAEILVRGVDVDPDQLRKKLKLRGTQQRGVVIARVGQRAVAYICGPRERG
ncbi:THUMP-like domain-containing protein [uncultured Corynebacterium sp.]|mgnify:CR=1 FL=1|uniref:THUMP-like domain-containing protein n=1 Tax=uncultured Corynebacterium sp. TaxID=159447 RepID=UPI0025924D08|nr:SAM-dependent methyltransferase [uncultured Corynebacterium sp.]